MKKKPLTGRVALVAGATRGGGRVFRRIMRAHTRLDVVVDTALDDFRSWLDRTA